MARRAVAGMLLTFGLLFASLALSASWLRATVFDPSRTRTVAADVLADPAVLDDLAGRLAGPLADATGTDPVALEPQVRERLDDPAVTGALPYVVVGLHQAVLGEGTEVALPASVGEQLTGVPGTPPVTFTVPEVPLLARADDVVDRAAAALWLIAGGFLVAGFALHPRRDLALKRAGRWAIVSAGLALLWTAVVPRAVVPRVTDSPYAAALGRAVADATAGMRPLLLTIAAGGVVLLVVGTAWTRAAKAARRGWEADAAVRAAQWASPYPTGPGRPPGGPYPSAWAPPQGAARAARRPGRSVGFGPAHRRPADGRDPGRPGEYRL